MPRSPAASLVAASALLACRAEAPVAPVPPPTTADVTPAPTPPLAPADAPTPVAGSCDSWKRALSPSCEALGPPVTASAAGNYWPAAGAVDRDTCHGGWNSGGFAPQAITLDLGDARPVGHVILVAAMTPGGAVTHVVEVSGDGTRFEPRGRYTAEMVEGGVYAVTLSPPALARYVRVRTERSPSWVAWHEIVPVACPGEQATPPAAAAPVAAPASAKAPAPPARVVPGYGACRRDADCHGNDTCHPNACTSLPIQYAPVACTADCVGPMDCGAGHCACVSGRCAVVTTRPELEDDPLLPPR